ncbi:HNH endonuclease [Paeniglutamicibacter antarcticus]|uniref:DUF222 domain-containing protein n=1 Tax=Paeniglutamicibacter antarcticus TaxID=494023 RepID=A0ABP9TJ99_9MICC
MATTSDSRDSGGVAHYATGEDLSYAALLERGLDMGVLISEYVTRAGVQGVRTLARALSLVPSEQHAHESVEAINAYECLKSTASAKQAEQACTLEDVVTADRNAKGIREKHPSWGIGADVALARHESPRTGVQFLNYSRILTEDLSYATQGLKDGTITEDEAQLIVREVRNLRSENRRLIDQMLFCETHNAFGSGGAILREMIRGWAAILEPGAETDLEEKAMKARYIDLYQIDAHRMKITGLLPLEYGVALCQVLARESGHAQAAGDTRNRGQIAADFLLESLTGIREPNGIPLQVSLIMTDRTLLEGNQEPALIPGYGFISAKKAKNLFTGNPQNPLDTWIRRLYTAPGTGDLVAMDSKARLFKGSLKRFITLRDQHCRTPYCNGRIEHLDHVVQVRRGGPTTAENSSSRCKWCNATKEAPDWEECTISGDRHTIRVTTSSGHIYSSTAPPLPGAHSQSKHPQDE